MPGLNEYKIYYSENELHILRIFFSNPGGNIFVLRDSLSAEVKALLLARYSRSKELSMQKLFLKEFYPEMDLQTINYSEKLYLNNSSSKKVQEINNRIINEFGDDSVRELANITLGIEGIDQITTKMIESSKLFRGIEKSTRYIDFTKPLKLNKNNEIIGYDKDGISKVYLYKVPKAISESNYKEIYENTIDELFEFYKELNNKIFEKLNNEYPIENEKFPDDKTGELIEYNKLSDEKKEIARKAYNQAIKAKSYDICRSILPLSTLTNLGFNLDFRTLGEVTANMYVSKNEEIKNVAENIYNEANNYAPTLINWIKLEHGKEYIKNIKRQGEEIPKLIENLKEESKNNNEAYNDIKILEIENEDDAEIKFATGVLYPYTNTSYQHLEEILRGNKKILNDVIDLSSMLRGNNRRNKVNDAGGLVNYIIEFLIPISVWRDLARHRPLTQIRQDFTIDNGYEIPQKIIDIGYEKEFKDKIYAAESLYKTLYSDERTKQYAQESVTFAHKIRTSFALDFKEVAWIIELRSSKQGDSRYRKIMFELYNELLKVQPDLTKKEIKHLNTNKSGIGREYSLYLKLKNDKK